MSKQDSFKGVPIIWDGEEGDPSIHQTLHEWWGVDAQPLDDEMIARLTEQLDEAWRACT